MHAQWLHQSGACVAFTMYSSDALLCFFSHSGTELANLFLVSLLFGRHIVCIGTEIYKLAMHSFISMALMVSSPPCFGMEGVLF